MLRQIDVVTAEHGVFIALRFGRISDRALCRKAREEIMRATQDEILLRTDRQRMVLIERFAIVRAEEIGELIAAEKRNSSQSRGDPRQSDAGIDAVEIERAEFVVTKRGALRGDIEDGAFAQRFPVTEGC